MKKTIVAILAMALLLTLCCGTALAYTGEKGKEIARQTVVNHPAVLDLNAVGMLQNRVRVNTDKV